MLYACKFSDGAYSRLKFQGLEPRVSVLGIPKFRLQGEVATLLLTCLLRHLLCLLTGYLFLQLKAWKIARWLACLVSGLLGWLTCLLAFARETRKREAEKKRRLPLRKTMR